MTACITCGMDVDQLVRFGGLSVTTVPPAATWNGSLIHGLSEAQIKILAVLAQRQKASHFALYVASTREDMDSKKSVHVQVCKMRRLLPRGLSIQNIHGWGYELKLEEEPMTTVQEAPDAPKTMRDLAVLAAGNIADTDQVAVLTVVKADGKVHVIPVQAGPAAAAQALALGVVVLTKALQARPAAQSQPPAAS